MSEPDVSRPHLPIVTLVAIGLGIGALSGLLGVGGGIVLVPILVSLCGYNQRLAAGTSVLAILPAAIVGGSGYALMGNIDWWATLALAVGMIVGAQIGSYLLARLPLAVLRWIFLAFLAVTMVSLWLVIPSRDAQIEDSIATLLLLVLTGLVTGMVSGVLGVGGGVIIVPILIMWFGASDLVAKGTSLLMMIPGSISATIGNVMRRNVDLRAALAIGLSAGVMAPLGSWLATLLTPFASNAIFSCLLAVVFVQMVVRMLRSR